MIVLCTCVIRASAYSRAALLSIVHWALTTATEDHWIHSGIELERQTHSLQMAQFRVSGHKDPVENKLSEHTHPSTDDRLHLAGMYCFFLFVCSMALIISTCNSANRKLPAFTTAVYLTIDWSVLAVVGLDECKWPIMC